MSLWVKICGLSLADSVEVAAQAGADAVGFVFHDGSPRNVTPRQAAALAASVPRGVAIVAVMRHPKQTLLDEVFSAFTPHYLQTDQRDIEGLEVPKDVGLLPVLRTGSALPQPLPQTFLYESAESGRGERANWIEAARLARTSRLILAGGLGPETVGEAILATRPFGVDVSSGVESAPGIKDANKIRAFITAARAAVAP